MGIDPVRRSQLGHEHHEFGIDWLCRVMGVERTRFYRWRRDHEVRASHAAAEEQPADHIERIHTDSGGTYGAGLTHPQILIRHSLNSIRRLLATTNLAPAINVLAAIAREQWRIVHQTRAAISHHNRRGDPLPAHLLI